MEKAARSYKAATGVGCDGRSCEIPREVEECGAMTVILSGSEWSCMLLHIVLQAALNEVMKVYPLSTLRALVDDITAFTEGRNHELAGIAQKIPRAMEREKGRDKQSRCVMQLSGREVSRMQKKRRSRSCNQCGHTRSGPENENEAVGS